MTAFIDWIYNFFSGLGYFGIFVMMTIESSFIPFPSEIVMPPAGALVSEGKMGFFQVFLAGTAGAWLGASINYFLWYYLGSPILRKMIEKYGKFVFLKIEHYNQAEKYFEKNGGKTTLIGRFIPWIRQIISLPAGVFRMNFAKFSIFTIIGAGLWNLILMGIGYFFNEKREMLIGNLKLFGVILLVFVAIYIAYHIFAKRKFHEMQK